ncbi:MAG: isoprenyl transferase [Phycisphaeraceae bacterium]
MASTTAKHDMPAPAAASAFQLPRAATPVHVAIIMDGNGRWAKQQGESRTFGHRRGADVVRDIVSESSRLGIDVLTLFSFSTENWTRSADEVEFLMNLYVEYLDRDRPHLIENNIRFQQIGRREGLPEMVLRELDDVAAATANNTGLTLTLALNYGSRAEITDAVRAIAGKVERGELSADAITEKTIAEHLYTTGLPDPDLLIRTAGEMRLSNYLLWQISYAELYVADVCWPDFTVEQYHTALSAYAQRRRKFGAVV